MRFEFDSTGPKGSIKKRIQFKQFSFGRNVYNVGFGDVMETGEINDLINSDNNDSKKVLATVAFAVKSFLQKYPEKYVYASGSCKIRSRLYKIGISNNLEEIQRDFTVYGYHNDQWELFEKHRHYEEFLIKLKNKKVYL
jgi:hypothetical protein